MLCVAWVALTALAVEGNAKASADGRDMLSDEEIKHFIEEGYVIVRDVFSKEAATAARDVLWDEIL